MIANLQRLITITTLAAAGLWAVYFGTRSNFFAATIGATLIVFGNALVLALQFLALYLVEPDAKRTAGGFSLVVAWCREVVTSPRVFFWRQPFRSTAVRDFAVLPTHGQRGVVLVHGLACNRGFWNPWLRRLRQDGVSSIAPNLEPVFGSIDDYVATIDDAVRQLHIATGMPPLLVAHSMGGVAVRRCLNRCPGALDRIHHVVTIGSPHCGTWLARYSNSENGRQMRLGSPWLMELAAQEAPSTYQRFTCYYSDCDNIVFPMHTATLPGADNRCVRGQPHVALAFHPEIYTEVRRLLAIA